MPNDARSMDAPSGTVAPGTGYPSGAKGPVTVFLADDHRMLLQGLCTLLSVERDVEVIGQASDGHEVVMQVRNLAPDVLVLDITMPGLSGIDVCRELRQDAKKPAILILSVHNDEEYVAQAIANGAAGYLLKDAAVEDLARAIRQVAAGQFFLGEKIPVSAMARVAQTGGDPYESLSPREREVLRLSAEGKSLREMGEALCIGAKTVDTHKRRLMKKLDLDTTMDLLKYTVRRGLIRL